MFMLSQQSRLRTSWPRRQRARPRPRPPPQLGFGVTFHPDLSPSLDRKPLRILVIQSVLNNPSSAELLNIDDS